MRFYIRFQITYLNLLITINSAIFLLVILSEIVFGITRFTTEDLSLFGALVFERGSLNNIGTLLTSTFLHLNLIHFLVNMYSLFRIGQIIESYFDGKKLFITYILGGLTGSFTTVFLYFIFDENIATVGASGAIFALIGLLIGGTLKRYRYGYKLPFNFSDVMTVAILSLSVGLIPGARINNLAHVGGLLAGILLGLVFKHSVGSYESPVEKQMVNLLLSLSQIFLIFSYAILFLGILY